MKTRLTSIFLLTLALALVPMSCTDLDLEPDSELTAEKFFADQENLVFAFGAAYTQLYFFLGHKFGPIGMECGTDMLVVPQRGGDWFDGGEWHRFHRHTWTPLDNYAAHWWGNCFTGINRVNSILFQFELLDPEEVPTRDIAIAELRAFRALYYYWLMDVFGNVPIITDFDVPDDFSPETRPRQEVYDFIETELLESRDLLEKETGLNTYGRVNYWTAQTILAHLYMNSEVYIGTPRYDEAEAVLDDIINNGGFALAADYFDNFDLEPYNSPEIIFGIPFDEVEATGMEIHVFSLHYNLQDKFGMEEQPWNGISMQEDFFNSFEDGDLRIGDGGDRGLLYGPQFDAEGNRITDPSFEKFNPADPSAPRDPDGAPLTLTPEINMLEPNCLRQAGVRIRKWSFDEQATRYISADMPVFRYADVLLLKAEAAIRNGRPGDALQPLNDVRSRAGLDPLAAATLEDVYWERGHELFAEGHRRRDMIRFGTYHEPRWEMEGSEPCKSIWPVPQEQIDVNGNLVQNPCY